MYKTCKYFTFPSLTITFCSLVVIEALLLTSLSGSSSGEVITVNGQKLDPNTLTFTTTKPLSSVLSVPSETRRFNSRSYSEALFPLKETPSPGGFWKTKQEWKAYWVKDWTVKKVYIPIWKRVWGPTEVREWVPTGVAKPKPASVGNKHGSIIY